MRFLLQHYQSQENHLLHGWQPAHEETAQPSACSLLLEAQRAPAMQSGAGAHGIGCCGGQAARGCCVGRCASTTPRAAAEGQGSCHVCAADLYGAASQCGAAWRQAVGFGARGGASQLRVAVPVVVASEEHDAPVHGDHALVSLVDASERMSASSAACVAALSASCCLSGAGWKSRRGVLIVNAVSSLAPPALDLRAGVSRWLGCSSSGSPDSSAGIATLVSGKIRLKAADKLSIGNGLPSWTAPDSSRALPTSSEARSLVQRNCSLMTPGSMPPRET